MTPDVLYQEFEWGTVAKAAVPVLLQTENGKSLSV